MEVIALDLYRLKPRDEQVTPIEPLFNWQQEQLTGVDPALTVAYTVPEGKALILKRLSAEFYSTEVNSSSLFRVIYITDASETGATAARLHSDYTNKVFTAADDRFTIDINVNNLILPSRTTIVAWSAFDSTGATTGVITLSTFGTLLPLGNITRVH